MSLCEFGGKREEEKKREDKMNNQFGHSKFNGKGFRGKSNGKPWKTNDNKEREERLTYEREMKFGVIYNSYSKHLETPSIVLEHLENYLKMTIADVGNEVAEAVISRNEYDWQKDRPKRVAAVSTDPYAKKLEEEENQTIFEHEIKLWITKKDKYRSGMKSAFSIIMDKYT